MVSFIFGGSFNPVHMGHIEPLLALQKQYNIPHIELLPNAVSPFKVEQEQMKDEHRIEMLKIATAQTESLSINTHEVAAKGVSYTYQTIKALTKRTQGLFFIMGLDSLMSLPNWKEPGQILDRCSLIVLPRPDQNIKMLENLPDMLKSRIESSFNLKTADVVGKIYLVDTPLLAVSSSQIRADLKKGKSQIKYIDPSVLNYIHKHHLYA